MIDSSRCLNLFFVIDFEASVFPVLDDVVKKRGCNRQYSKLMFHVFAIELFSVK